MDLYHDKRFPGESPAYRAARDELLKQEMALRQLQERVAAMRRQLPQGGAVPQDYVFDELIQGQPCLTRMSTLFEEGKNSLILYSFMYGPDWDKPCPACTSILDSLNGGVRHVRDKVNIAVVARAPLEKLMRWADQRGWHNLRLLSSYNNSYNTDYYGETRGGDQVPAVNVFTKHNNGIYHFYNTELLYTPEPQGMGPRHVDSLWPLWSYFDLTPEGRGTDWFPRLYYK